MKFQWRSTQTAPQFSCWVRKLTVKGSDITANDLKILNQLIRDIKESAGPITPVTHGCSSLPQEPIPHVIEYEQRRKDDVVGVSWRMTTPGNFIGLELIPATATY